MRDKKIICTSRRVSISYGSKGSAGGVRGGADGRGVDWTPTAGGFFFGDFSPGGLSQPVGSAAGGGYWQGLAPSAR